MRLFIFIVCLLFLPVPIARAADESMVPPECRLLPDHKPDSGTAYQPGVDVHGKAVVPADINAVPSGFAGETVIVPITVNLVKRINSVDIPGLKLEGNLGYLEIHPDGRVSHNGQDWTSQVHVLCGKSPVTDNGQGAGDVISSPTIDGQTTTKQDSHE